MPVVVIGLNYRTCPVEFREPFAFPVDRTPAVLAALRSRGLAPEGVLVSTCHRVELYAGGPQFGPAVFEDLGRFLVDQSGYTGPVAPPFYTRSEPESLEHLFRVAAGLDSMVLGETEILGQLKQAYDLALRHRCTGPLLNRAFQRAFNVAKHIRTATLIQRGNISVASVAVELAQKVFDSLADRAVLVIGAGDTSEKTLRALIGRGVGRVWVTNRSPERALALAQAVGGQALPFDAWGDALGEVDMIVSSTAAPHFVLDRPRLAGYERLRRRRPLLLIDLAVPRDIDPEVNLLEDVYLYNVDDLQAIADEYLRQRRQEVARCESIIRDKVQQWSHR